MIADNASRSRAMHEVRLARAADLPSVMELLPELDGEAYGERFPGKTCADFTHWKYFANPAGEAAVGVALDGERVVSIVAGTPKRVWLDGQVALAFELGDFITAAEHRKRGLFSALINLVCAAAQDRGAAFTYVRPNDVSFPILASHLSFREPANIQSRRYIGLSGAVQRKLGIPAALLRGIGIEALFRALTLPRNAASVQVERIERFAEDADELWARTRDQYRFALVRDSRYLNWRYVDCPTPYRRWVARRQNQFAGYLVAFVARARPIATILDVYTDPRDEEAAGALLHDALNDMLRAGTQVVYTWSPQTGAASCADRLLKRTCRFLHQELHFAMRPAGEPDSPALPPSGWQLAAGDFDGF
jgi:GNAT superfamily N-acetyltransferase